MKVKLVAMALAAFISGVLIALGALFLWVSDRATSSSPDPVPATDASDDRKMGGVAEHVFFGSVVEELEEVKDEYPMTHGGISRRGQGGAQGVLV